MTTKLPTRIGYARGLLKKTLNSSRLLLLSAIGIVYGDIGTSPLYALKSSFIIGGLESTPDNVLGLISLFIWTLFLVVTIKYIYLVMNIDKDEERGGILALSFLCSNLKHSHYKTVSILLGMVGGALLFGDGVITPAISVLSALEGLNIVSSGIQKYIILLSIGILTLLFGFQKIGSNKLGIFFGPVMIIWFLTLASLGIYNIIAEPMILKALNPYFVVRFILDNGWAAFKALSGVFLVVTGAEALYADRGHFGNTPIKQAWYFLVFPSLILNYLGQGSLLLRYPELISDPFYHLIPSAGLYPLIILATMATIIASQAMISGIFSLSWQAIMLGYLPKLKVVHLSDNPGQVYVPVVNKVLYILTIVAILHFQTSHQLSFAYGLSVAGVMLITTILFSMLLLSRKPLNTLKVIMISGMLFLDSTFVLTSIIKIFEGAWYTLLITSITPTVFKDSILVTDLMRVYQYGFGN